MSLLNVMCLTKIAEAELNKPDRGAFGSICRLIAGRARAYDLQFVQGSLSTKNCAYVMACAALAAAHERTREDLVSLLEIAQSAKPDDDGTFIRVMEQALT